MQNTGFFSTDIEDPLYYLVYWISERQKIFWQRYQNVHTPWTNDPIFRRTKFTNTYRVLDRASQDLLRRVIYNGKQYSKRDMLYRIIIYRHFNHPYTWSRLIEEFGDITLDISKQKLLEYLASLTEPIYNKAYMLTSGFTKGQRYSKFSGMDKFHAYFEIFYQEIFENNYYTHLLGCSSMKELFFALKTITGVGDFIAFQYCIDFNYSKLFNFSENEFIIAGTGAKRGIDRTWLEMYNQPYEDVIYWTKDNINSLFNQYDLEFTPIPNRLLTLADIHNCYCEVGKYLKALSPNKNIAGEKQISHRFYYDRKKEKIQYTFPPDWNVKL